MIKIDNFDERMIEQKKDRDQVFVEPIKNILLSKKIRKKNFKANPSSQ